VLNKAYRSGTRKEVPIFKYDAGLWSVEVLRSRNPDEVANNCRTSVAMIEQSYAKYLGGSLIPCIN